MQRVKNPNAPASPVTAQDKTDLQDALTAIASNAAPTFDEIRKALTAGKRDRFTDGMIAQTAKDLGLTVFNA